MNNYDISVGANSKISILSEQSFSATKLSQITQTINSSINGDPEISIDEWLKLDGCVWKDFIFVSEDFFQKAAHKMLEKLSKSNFPSKRGYLMSCYPNEVSMFEFDDLFKKITEQTGVNEILWANSVPVKGEQPFIFFVLLD